MTAIALGPWELGAPIGHGGMGAVWRARHARTGQHAAVKEIAAPSAEALRGLRREIAALSRIDHPGFVRFLDHGEQEGVPWVAMELVEGQTLRAWWGRLDAGDSATVAPTATAAHLDSAVTVDLLPSSPGGSDPEPGLPPPGGEAARGRLDALLPVVLRIARALAWLHGEGLLHRDLKPDNVLVRPDGRVCLVDLGLAHAVPSVAGRETIDGPGGFAGTPAYMAPEQLRGEVLDARTDLYALGCVLYELIGDRVPFGEASPAIRNRRRLLETPPALSQRFAGVPPPLDRVVTDLLHPDPRDRVSHALVVAAVLESILRARALPVPPPEGPPPRAYLYGARFTGRPAALHAIEEAVDGLARGQGGLLLLSAPSGGGKTRLALEAIRRAREAGLTVLVGSCPPQAGGTAAVPLAALRAPLTAVADQARARGTAWAERVFGPQGAVLAELEPRLRHLPAFASRPPPPELPPEAARTRLLLAVHHVVEASGEGPVLLVVDDLQWADELSLAYLQHAVGRSESVPLLVIATCRTEERTPGVEQLERHATGVLALEPLPAADLGAIAGDMLGGAVEDPELLELLARGAAGNPFFVGEFLRVAVSDGWLLRDDRGRWTVRGRAWADLPVPRTLPELLDRRLARLSPAADAVLRWCAVLGREADEEDLVALLGGSADDGLRELQAAQILETRPGGRWAFVHDKLLETSYDRIDAAERPPLHARVAERLASAGADPAVLALHWQNAGERDRARLAWYEAAARATDQGAWDDAERHTLAGLALVGHPDEADVRARLKMARLALDFSGRHAEAAVQAETCRAQAEVLGLDLLQAQSLREIGVQATRTGTWEVALACFDSAFPFADALFRVELWGERALAHYYAGRQDEAEADAAHASAELEMLDRADPERDSVTLTVRGTMALLMTNRGRWEEADALWAELLPVVRRGSEPFREALLHGNRGYIASQTGRYEDAIGHCEQELGFARRYGLAMVEVHALQNLAFAQMFLGRLDAAERLLEESQQLATRIGSARFEALALQDLGTLHLERDDPARARAVLEESHRLFTSIDSRDATSVAVTLIGARRMLGEPVEELADEMARLRAECEAQGEPEQVAAAWCETGQLEVARGGDGRPALARAEAVLEGCGFLPESWPYRRIQRLRAAIDRQSLA